MTSSTTNSKPHEPRPECYDKPVWTLRALRWVLPQLPGHLAHVVPTVWGQGIDNDLRERLMLAVAAANRCGYCMLAHGVMGKAAGLAADDVEGLLSGEDVGRDEGEKLALRYVRDLAQRGFASRDEGMFEALGDHYAPAGREAIDATAHVMNFANRFGNSFDAARHRLVGGCDHSRASWTDLAVVSSLFVPAALFVAPWVGALMVSQRRGPWSAVSSQLDQ